MLSLVELEHETYLGCMVHCLTTEREEVMGLLLGEIVERDSTMVSIIRDIIILRRSCKEKDRVEISPEQLVEASQNAEQVQLETGIPTRVIGWYHSHPHITVLPSHVDIATQAMYQTMDMNFVGLIFSVFNKDSSTDGRIQLIAFQAQRRRDNSENMMGGDGVNEMKEVPISIVSPIVQSPNILQRLVSLQEILLEEERDTLNTFSRVDEHPLKQKYNESIFNKALCCLLEYGYYPLIEVLEAKRRYCERRLQITFNQKLELQQEIEKIENKN